MKNILLSILLVLLASPLCSQQVADTTYLPEIRKPAYRPGKGPVILIEKDTTIFTLSVDDTNPSQIFW